jgi:hypothetical protein
VTLRTAPPSRIVTSGLERPHRALRDDARGGRPAGLPLWPFLKPIALGGLRYPTSPSPESSGGLSPDIIRRSPARASSVPDRRCRDRVRCGCHLARPPTPSSSWVLSVRRIRSELRAGEGCSRTVGSHAVLHDGVVQDTLMGTTVERQGPGDKGLRRPRAPLYRRH